MAELQAVPQENVLGIEGKSDGIPHSGESWSCPICFCSSWSLVLDMPCHPQHLWQLEELVPLLECKQWYLALTCYSEEDRQRSRLEHMRTSLNFCSAAGLDPSISSLHCFSFLMFVRAGRVPESSRFWESSGSEVVGSVRLSLLAKCWGIRCPDILSLTACALLPKHYYKKNNKNNLCTVLMIYSDRQRTRQCRYCDSSVGRHCIMIYSNLPRLPLVFAWILSVFDKRV